MSGIAATERYHSALDEGAEVKRLFERWAADSRFREAVAADARSALEKASIDLPVEEVEKAFRGGGGTVARSISRIAKLKSDWVRRFYGEEAVPSSSRMRSWRKRQIARQTLELGAASAESNIHASLCIELTNGCTVGCWFCAVSADRFEGAFPYETEAGSWRRSVSVLGDVLGPAVRSGFLYWATDPLDNPDYEHFCLDFFDATGVFPPTTTALPLKSPARTRALIKLAGEHDCWVNRFSILSLGMFDRVHAEFSARELARVECLPLNRESAFALANAGRFRERAGRDPELLGTNRRKLEAAPWYAHDAAYSAAEEYPIGTIGCVTGFLINMVTRSVKLISPCTADERWPLGAIVFAESTFRDADDLGRVLDDMIARAMVVEVSPRSRVELPRWITADISAERIVLRGRFGQTVVLDGDTGMLATIIASLQHGGSTAGEICDAVRERHGGPDDWTLHRLDELLQRGCLREEAIQHHIDL